MKNIIFSSIIILVSFPGCNKELTVQDIISNTINEYGGVLYKKSIMEFDFRGRQYSAMRNNGKFLYQRNYKDSLNSINEYISNKGTFRKENGNLVELSETDRRRIGNSINSVIYFASLPYPLQDKSAIKKLLGEDEFADKTYYVVEITFLEEGGGDDFDDRYIYWINKADFSMDFFAYYFHVNDGGSRFRVVHNERNVNGIILTDHDNYKSDKLKKNEIEKYLQLYKRNELKKLSEINLENVRVEIL